MSRQLDKVWESGMSEGQIRLLLIYSIAQGIDVSTQQRLFSLSGLGMEYSSILSNLTMLGVTPSHVGYRRVN